MFLGLGLKFVIRTAYFVEIARALGVGSYGAFIGVVALVGVAAPFGDFGSSSLLLQNVSRDRNLFAIYWGRGLITTCVTSIVLIAVVLAIATGILPATIPRQLVFIVAASDILVVSLITMAAEAYQAVDRLKGTAAINIAASAARLAGATTLIAIHHHPSALSWAYVYLSSAILVAAPAILLVTVSIGGAEVRWRHWVPEIRQGAHFSIGQCAQTLYNDIDKTMLARLSSLEATGVYGAAYRCVDVSFVPIASLLQACYCEFFRAGAGGVTQCIKYAKPLWAWALGYAVSVTVLLLLFAGLLPDVLGAGYGEAAEAVRWLAVLPTLKVASYFFSNMLTGANRQGARAFLQVGVGLFNVLINLWLIPAYSWRGAAWSSIASDGLLAIGAGTAVFIIARNERITQIGIGPPAAPPVGEGRDGVWLEHSQNGAQVVDIN